MKKIIYRVAASILAMSVLLCVSAFAASTPVLTTAEKVLATGVTLDANVINAVRTGENFSVTLQENASTGYQWTYTAAAGLEKVGESVVPPKAGLVGAPSKKTWTFRAANAGNYTLQFAYARSWETGVAPAQTVTLRIKAIDESTKIFTIKKNKTFKITRSENPSTGYIWTVEPNAAFKQLSIKTLAPESGKAGMLEIVGAPVVKTWTFKALHKGLYILHMTYARPFEKGVPPIKIADYTIQVS